ncbi:MAG: hypothetical protein ACRDY7_15295 [Acidimicrobiia bacterium]
MKRPVLVFVLVVTAMAATGAVYALRDRPPGNGPLEGALLGTYGQLLEIGAPYSAGHVLLLNDGDEPAVLEHVRLLGATGGIEFLGVRTRPWPGPDDPGTFIGDVGFPPENFITKPIAEQHVVAVAKQFNVDGDPDDGLELAIGVTATRPGVARSRAVEVTYRVGDTRYREEYPATIYLCAPAEAFPGDTCPGDARGRFSDKVAEPPRSPS